MSVNLKPALDLELEEFLKSIPAENTLKFETLQAERDEMAEESSPENTFKDPEISHREVQISVPGGEIALSIIEPRVRTGSNRAGIYHMHGGCFVMGTNLSGIGMLFEWVKQCDAVLVSVEYRLAPEHPDPTPIEDCYAGLQWINEHSKELEVDVERIMITGLSAGGGLTAGLALLTRDRKGPKICGQLMVYPMLDDRVESTSSKQYMTEGTLTGNDCIVSWDWLLPGKRGSEDVSVYAAPSRETDLSGLPEAWIDIGSADVLRDESIDYASKLWASGTQCEIHVWPGACHAFDLISPDSRISKTAMDLRLTWVKRILGVVG